MISKHNFDMFEIVYYKHVEAPVVYSSTLYYMYTYSHCAWSIDRPKLYYLTGLGDSFIYHTCRHTSYERDYMVAKIK